MVHVSIVGKVQNFNLQTICIQEMGLLICQNLLKWRKCSFLLFMHLFSCGKFEVVKQSTLVILAIFHAKVPLLPEECDIMIMHCTGVEAGTDEAIYQDFRVRRHAIQQWLEYLVQHHPTFQSHQVAVDYTRLNQLPIDGLVHDRLRAMLTLVLLKHHMMVMHNNQTHYSQLNLCQIYRTGKLKKIICVKLLCKQMTL